MLGVEGYGSDDNSDSDSTSNNNATVSLKKSLLPPSKSTKRTKKFAIELPKPSPGEEDEKPAKKPRLDRDSKGAASSGLVSMLPAPKQKNPIPSERVLGACKGPGLVFNAKRANTTLEYSGNDVEDMNLAPSMPLFMPNSVARGKPNISVEESIPRAKEPPTNIDFFSIGMYASILNVWRIYLMLAESSSSRSQITTDTKFSLSTLSSAPKIEEFTPPEPTPQDPYPGYYLLPSGKYAAYDAVYYETFYKKWQAEFDKYVRDLEKGKIKGFEELDEDKATGVNAMEEMEKARVGIQEREERKALTKGSNDVQAPKMNIKVICGFHSSYRETSNLNIGSCPQRESKITASTFHVTYRSVPESGSPRRANCSGEKEQKGSWKQIWCVELATEI